MNYLRTYCNLIRNAENRNTPKVYTEKHHIFPISIYGKNNRVVKLTGREHYIAHVLLEKICTKRYGVDHWKTHKMTYAHCMMKRSGYYNSYLYESAKIRRNNFLIGRYVSPETRQKLSDANKGKIIPLEVRKKISEAIKGEKNYNFGKNLSKETREKISETRKLNYQIENHPNYGKNLSPETREKISKSSMGKVISNEVRKKISESTKGEKSHMFGKSIPDEIKLKISQKLKGNPLLEETKIKISQAHIGKKWWNNGHITKFAVECPGDEWILGRLSFNWSYESRKKISGKNNPNYGVKPSPEKTEKNRRSNSKYIYKCISPSGEEYITYSMKQFCKEHNISKPMMLAVAHNKKEHFRGWKVEILSTKEE